MIVKAEKDGQCRMCEEKIYAGDDIDRELNEGDVCIECFNCAGYGPASNSELEDMGHFD